MKAEIPYKADNDQPLNKEQFASFRGILGKVSWLAQTTRPDIAYDCLELSIHHKDAKVKDLKNIYKVVD